MIHPLARRVAKARCRKRLGRGFVRRMRLRLEEDPVTDASRRRDTGIEKSGLLPQGEDRAPERPGSALADA